MSDLTFTCGRTCRPFCEECRFMPLFVAIGPTRVFSHTSTVRCEYKDTDSLAGAVGAMGGTFLGFNVFELFQTDEEGFGFTLPEWKHPLVLRPDMTIAYDDYRGSWGNVEDLATLKSHYAIAVAKKAAEDQGWICENQPNGNLVVYHPEGGFITVSALGDTVDVDLCNFTGSSCVEAGNVIESALGKVVQNVTKPEMFQEQVKLAQ